MKKYKVVVTIPAIIEVTAETACDANEIVKKNSGRTRRDEKR